jgi:hypothetical protein
VLTARRLQSGSGLNELFHYTTERTVHHDPDVATFIPNGQKPDRVYGLRCTKRFDKLLTAVAGKMGSVNEHPERFSPFGKAKKAKATTSKAATSKAATSKAATSKAAISKAATSKAATSKAAKSEAATSKARKPLLFPFLLLESKKETSDTDDYDTFLQSAFPIRTFLKLQNELRFCAGKKSQWGTGGPFMWYLSHKGPLWEVAGAYTVEQKPHSSSDPLYVRPP